MKRWKTVARTTGVTASNVTRTYRSKKAAYDHVVLLRQAYEANPGDAASKVSVYVAEGESGFELYERVNF